MILKFQNAEEKEEREALSLYSNSAEIKNPRFVRKTRTSRGNAETFSRKSPVFWGFFPEVLGLFRCSIGGYTNTRELL